MEIANVRIDEKFRIQERMVDYNSNGDFTKPRNDEIFLETNNDFQNEGEPRHEQSSKPSTKLRVEIGTPTLGKNMTKNYSPKQIIRSRDKDVMKRSRINEELCLTSQVEPKRIDELVKDDHWMKAMKEELDQILKK